MQIEHYPVCQTNENINALIQDKYAEEEKKAIAAGESELKAGEKVLKEATRLPEFQAVKSWQDTIMAEIKLKKH